MKKLIASVCISCSFMSFAKATNLECQAGLVGLGESYLLKKVLNDSATTFSGGDQEVQFWVLSNNDTITLQTSAASSAQKTLQQGPALLPGQTVTQIFQLEIAGANTAYFLKCNAK